MCVRACVCWCKRCTVIHVPNIQTHNEHAGIMKTDFYVHICVCMRVAFCSSPLLAFNSCLYSWDLREIDKRCLRRLRSLASKETDIQFRSRPLIHWLVISFVRCSDSSVYLYTTLCSLEIRTLLVVVVRFKCGATACELIVEFSRLNVQPVTMWIQAIHCSTTMRRRKRTHLFWNNKRF